MGFYGRFAVAYGTLWLGLTILLFTRTSFHIGEGGLVVMVLGCLGFAAVTRPAPRPAQPGQAAPLPTATVTREPPPPPAPGT